MSINSFSRRHFLKEAGMGMAMLGLAQLHAEDTNPFKVKPTHYKPKAKYIIHIVANGGPSQMDTFDPKPALEKYAGKKLPFHLETERVTSGAYPSPFKFKKYGQCGMDISELFQELGPHADDICLIRSMHTNVPNHAPSLMMLNCGDLTLPRPSMGSWINYGLGSENENLPGFVAMCPKGLPSKGANNWRSAFLPGMYQGTYIDSQHKEIDRLIENIRNKSVSLETQRKQFDLLHSLNDGYNKTRPGDPKLTARIQSFELAYKMQIEATDAFDVSQEPQYIQDMYGSSVHGRQALIARRLVERGTRFVQLYHGADEPWDHHFDINKEIKKCAQESSQPIAALLTDLKQRGLLDETLVIWGGEFGRTPTVELPKVGMKKKTKGPGRDHNHHGFSMWMAGGGIKGGTIYGQTDEFGFAAIENKVHIHDLHATILKLMGLDHEELTYRYSGRDFRLTDVEGYVVNEIIS